MTTSFSSSPTTKFKEYENYDGLGLAELVRKGEVSAAELAEAAIERIQTRNPIINAVIEPMFDEGKRLIAQGYGDGPFAGVPFLLKDILAAYAGFPMRNGSRAYQNHVPTQDSELVRRFKKAGLVILGKTNTPEFGLMGTTEPELFGPSRNPWNLEHSTGGSSGGAGAAVASGMVPLASAGDGGGSIRIPASCCGLFGLKPTRGRNPTGPIGGECWQGAVVEHAITRSVRDSATLLDLTQGMNSGGRCQTARPEIPYAQEILKPPGKLRIGYSTRSPIGTPVDPECVQATTRTVELLRKLGHDVEEAHPEIDGLALARSYFTMYYGEVAANVAASAAELGRKPRQSDFEVTTWLLAKLGLKCRAGDFVSAIRRWDLAALAMGRYHQNYDLYLTPTMAGLPAKLGELLPKPVEKTCLGLLLHLGLEGLLYTSGAAEKLLVHSLERSPFTQLANLTGQPAMSVPLQWSRTELPIGMQFIAPFGDEGLLFRLAAQLEKAQPWFNRRPIALSSA
jgi:amidase